MDGTKVLVETKDLARTNYYYIYSTGSHSQGRLVENAINTTTKSTYIWIDEGVMKAAEVVVRERNRIHTPRSIITNKENRTQT